MPFLAFFIFNAVTEFLKEFRPKQGLDFFTSPRPKDRGYLATQIDIEPKKSVFILLLKKLAKTLGSIIQPFH